MNKKKYSFMFVFLILCVWILLLISSASGQQSIVTAEYARHDQSITYILDTDVFQHGDYVALAIYRYPNPAVAGWIWSAWAEPGKSSFTFQAPALSNENILFSVQTWNTQHGHRDLAWFWVTHPDYRADLNFAKGRERIDNGSWLHIQLPGIAFITHPGEVMGKAVGITYNTNDHVTCWPSLWVDDDKVAQGANVKCGTNQNLTVFTASSGTGRQGESWHNIIASGHHSLVLRMLPATLGVARFNKDKRDWWDRYYGTSNSEVSKRYILSSIGHLYFSAKGEAQLDIAAKNGTSYRSWLSSALISNPNPNSTFMDVRSPGVSGGNRNFWHATGWISSRLESSILSDTMGVDAVSTVRLLEGAQKLNQVIYQIDPFGSLPTGQLVAGGWQQGEIVLLHQWVNAGWSVMVPRNVQRIGNWRGIGMYIYDIPSGFYAAIISGNLGSRTGGKKPIVIRGGFLDGTVPLTAALFDLGLNTMDVGPLDYFGGWQEGYLQETFAGFRDLNMEAETGVHMALGPLYGALARGVLTIAPEFWTAANYLASRGFVENGFRSFRAYKKMFGSAGPGFQLHHVVRQFDWNIVKFGYENIHHQANIIRLSNLVHSQINTFYRHAQPGLTGSSEVLNTWILKQPFHIQYEIGLRILQLHGVTNLPRP